MAELQECFMYGAGVNNELKRIQEIRGVEQKQKYLYDKIKVMTKKGHLPEKIAEQLTKNIKNLSTEELNKAGVILYLSEKLGNINPAYPKELLCGGFVEIDDNGEVYNKLKEILSYKERNFGEQANKIKNLMQEKEELVNTLKKETKLVDFTNYRDLESEDNILETYLTEQEKQEITTEIQNIDNKIKQNGKAVSIQAGDIFKEFRVEHIDGKTRIKLDATEYPHDPNLVLTPYIGLKAEVAEVAEVSLSTNLGKLTIDKDSLKLKNKLPITSDKNNVPRLELNNVTVEATLKKTKIGVSYSYDKDEGQNIEGKAGSENFKGVLGHNSKSGSYKGASASRGNVTINANTKDDIPASVEKDKNLVSENKNLDSVSIPFAGPYGGASVESNASKPLLSRFLDRINPFHMNEKSGPYGWSKHTDSNPIQTSMTELTGAGGMSDDDG